MITTAEYQSRRKKLAEHLPPDTLAIIPAATEFIRNGDAHYRFRQDSDFYYLTGFNEPDALLIITAGAQSQSILFNRPHDKIQEQWTGKRLGQEGALEILGVDGAFALDFLEKKLPEILSGQKAIYYSMGRYPRWEKRIWQAWQIVKSQIRRGIQAPEAFCDLAPLLSEMRLFKSEAEVTLMQKAAKISAAAHIRAMQHAQQAQFEYQLEAELMYELARQGCRNTAYDSIVASGKNACILHYSENNQVLGDGELILIDAGGEFENYAADITRTFPKNGRFTKEQRLLYQLVLHAQRAGIDSIRPGNSWYKAQQKIVYILTEGLVEFGLLQGQVDDLVETEAYKPFYMHHSGHWLGLDVHDSGHYKVNGQWRTLEPGMVLTVEPGLYIPENMPGVDSRWLGIGIRIEDDVRVTPQGHHVMSADAAVEIDEIEAIVRG